MLDDRVPFTHLGAGFPRVIPLVEILFELGHQVTFGSCVVTNTPQEAQQVLGQRCHFVDLSQPGSAAEFVNQHGHEFDVLWVSRPPNMRRLQTQIPQEALLWKQIPLVVYDAEAIFALRNQLQNTYYPNAQPGLSLEEELALTNAANVITSVSKAEAVHFEKTGKPTHVLSTTCAASPTEKAFDQRKGLLFVGPLRGDKDNPHPNSDALIWFCEQVAPILRGQMGNDFQLKVAGLVERADLDRLSQGGVELLGMVPDLQELYNTSRIFIAPHRFAAGIPLKVIESATFGLPVVSSDLLAKQLGWRHQEEIVGADHDDAKAFAEACMTLYYDQQAWMTIRHGALQRVREEYSRARLKSVVEQVLAKPRRNPFYLPFQLLLKKLGIR